jgi:hypothetical protein
MCGRRCAETIKVARGRVPIWRLALFRFVVGGSDEAGANRVVKKLTGGLIVRGDFLSERFQVNGFPNVIERRVLVAAKLSVIHIISKLKWT